MGMPSQSQSNTNSRRLSKSSKCSMINMGVRESIQGLSLDRRFSLPQERRYSRGGSFRNTLGNSVVDIKSDSIVKRGVRRHSRHSLSSLGQIPINEFKEKHSLMRVGDAIEADNAPMNMISRKNARLMIVTVIIL